MKNNSESSARRVHQYFDEIDSVRQSRVWHPTPYSWELERFMSLMGLEGRHVLDVGCGAGNLALAAVARGAKGSASDISAEAVAVTKSNSDELNLPVTAIESDGLRCWISQKSKFDVIVCNPPCFDVLSEIDHANEDPFLNSYLLVDVLKDYRKVLSEKGCFLSVVSGLQNIDFVRATQNKEIKPFIVYRQIPAVVTNRDDLDRLVAAGLLGRRGSEIYWNAYYFGLFHF